MKDRIVQAISEQYCHLLPSLIGWCINDYDNIRETESFIIALTELVQDGIVVYDAATRKYNIK